MTLILISLYLNTCQQFVPGECPRLVAVKLAKNVHKSHLFELTVIAQFGHGVLAVLRLQVVQHGSLLVKVSSLLQVKCNRLIIQVIWANQLYQSIPLKSCHSCSKLQFMIFTPPPPPLPHILSNFLNFVFNLFFSILCLRHL